jgi:BirA family biotin operon repressor/biotin-[acetyl-CoA-carboxylase] ligase
MMLCTLSAADAVIHLTALPVELKWPNDLLVRGRKLAGLLAESVFQGDQLESVVVGMGMNVNVTFADAPPFIATATSLQLELGHPVQRLPLLAAYVNGVAQRYALLKSGLNPYEEWSSRLATLGRPVTVRLSGKPACDAGAQTDLGDRYLHGVAQGVDMDGALLLRTPDGVVHRLVAADVSLQGAIPGSATQIGANSCEGSDQRSPQTSI